MAIAAENLRRVQYIERRLKLRGWNEVEVRRPQDEPMIETVRGGYVICSDGRRVIIPTSREMAIIENLARKPHFQTPDWEKIYQGPKVFGGLTGMKLNTHGGDRRGTAKTVTDIKKDGFIPAVHGDEHGVCGLQGLAENGDMPTPHKLRYLAHHDPKLAERVAFYRVGGHHRETELFINLMSGLTQEAAEDGSRFNYDLWYMLVHRVGLGRSVDFAAHAVEQLSPVRRAVIVAQV